MSDAPLTGEQIAALVAEVEDQLASGEHRHTIIVAGGSLLACSRAAADRSLFTFYDG